MDNNYCNNCTNPCNRCKRACAKPYFNLWNDPYDPSYWVWEMGGESGKVKVPSFNETDTKLSINYSNPALTYSAEKHVDTITGPQLGSIINLDELRDVDATSPDACSILVFNPGCGLCPCSPDEEMWKKYTIPDATEELTPDDQGRVKVLTKTDCGCITEAFIPAQPDLECIITNIMNAIKPFEGEGVMIDTQSGGSTPEFYGGLNPATGDFFIHWSDWWRRALLDISLLKDDVRQTIGGQEYNRVGQGQVNGKLTTTSSFDYKTGKMTYTITRIYFDKTTYTRDYLGVLSVPMYHYTWGAFPGTYDLSASHEILTQEGLALYNGHLFWGPGQLTVDEVININKTYTGSYTVSVNPGGGTSSWIDVLRLYNDWGDLDDDGIVKVRYKNPMNWKQC